MNQAGAVDPTTGRRSPSIAAFLSFVWPGLGHWYARRDRAALLFAVPVAIIVLIVLVEAAAGLGQLAALVIEPASALTVFILIVLLGIWREFSVIDSAIGIRPKGAWRGGRSILTIGLVTIIIAATHLWAGVVAWAFYGASSKIFTGPEGADAAPVVVDFPGSSAATGSASPDPNDAYAVEPFATPTTKTARINILLTGLDSAETRSVALTDTLIVASIDPTTGNVALVSFPRDISHFPLFDGRTYTGKINSFMAFVNNHQGQFNEKPLAALVHELSFLIGAPIHYYAAVDLTGFRRLVDAAGGVTVVNEHAINDPAYEGLDGHRGFKLSAGEHNLDGEGALAYVRSRDIAGDNDLDRAGRQQQVLLAIAAKLTNPSMLPRIPGLVEVAGDTLRTNFPSDRVGEMLALFQGREGTTRLIVLGPPYTDHAPSDQAGGTEELRLRMDRLAALSREVFGREGADPAPSATPAPGASGSP